VGEYVSGSSFLKDLAYSTVFVFVATFAAQVVLLVGTRNFARLLMGKYRSPREIQAIFMFVDVRGSTTIAERLGHAMYSAFLRDFFNDVSGAIHDAGGEVYQYVGDEVILVWPRDSRAARWLSCYRSMGGAIDALRPVYESKYGTVPEFKAGVHGGKVIVTEVGTLQKAHVYHGDVVNTTSRIQAKCNEAGFGLLASEEAVATLTPDERGAFRKIGPLPLRGKSDVIVIVGLQK
jgi:adenylate cyclase